MGISKTNVAKWVRRLKLATSGKRGDTPDPKDIPTETEIEGGADRHRLEVLRLWPHEYADVAKTVEKDPESGKRGDTPIP